ncbi:hypothetical protein NWT09_31010 [Mycolicibacterium sp. jd]|uniref:hypothetical protein n=1 Tax=unclassified Mycolicibacterium TaxID=2636767 RepID=UPI00351B8470
MIPDFVDHLALNPASVERTLIGVAEYSSFLNELCPLGSPVEKIVSTVVSGFDGINYAQLFNGLAELLEYDRHRVELPLGRPVVVLIVTQPPARDDEWSGAYQRLICAEDPSTAGRVLLVLATGDSTLEPADAMACPPGISRAGSSAVGIGAAAAQLVIDVLAGVHRGIGKPHIQPHGFSTKGSQQ